LPVVVAAVPTTVVSPEPAELAVVEQEASPILHRVLMLDQPLVAAEVEVVTTAAPRLVMLAAGTVPPELLLFDIQWRQPRVLEQLLIQRTVTSLLRSPRCKTIARGQFLQACHPLTTSWLVAAVAADIATVVLVVPVVY
jgi:hypothetical protein